MVRRFSWFVALVASVALVVAEAPAASADEPPPVGSGPERADDAPKGTTVAPQSGSTELPKTPSDLPPPENTGHTYLSIVLNSGVDQVFHTGERIFIRGQLISSTGTPVSGRVVKVYRYVGGEIKFAGSSTTSSSGVYTISGMPSIDTSYKAVYSTSSTTIKSKRLYLDATSAPRTLESRAEAAAFILGARRSEIQVTDSGDRWATYDHGILVEHGDRAWPVSGRLWSAYREKGSVLGRLGAPRGDAKCGLPEGACIQPFRTGSAYVNSHAKDAYVAYPTNRYALADLVAVALSQVGYSEPSYRHSKYNRWIGRTGSKDAWCGFFLSWLAYASGRPTAIPKATSFPALVRALKTQKRTSHTPAIGRLAMVDYFNDGRATHAGIVYHVTDSYVYLVEGNVASNGGSSKPRGVHKIRRPRSKILFYAEPLY